MKDKYAFPFLVGLDDLAKQILEKHVTSQTYPPHNLLMVDDDTFEIQLAVAGFDKDELEVVIEGQKLTVKGVKKEQPPESGAQFIHRGIATRKFTRAFELAPYIKLSNVSLKNGILGITTKVVIPESERPRTVEIA